MKEPKDIILNADGTLNQKSIDEYSLTVGSLQPLLNFVLGSEEFSEQIKSNLVIFLLVKGVKIDSLDSQANKEIFAMLTTAIIDKDIDKAKLFITQGAQLNEKIDNQNLINIALQSNDQEVILFLLKEMPKLFMTLDIDEFSYYYQTIKASFLENTDIHQALNSFAENYLEQYTKSKFEKLGKINEHDIPLLLVAREKTYETATFVVTNDDLAELTEQIKKLVTHSTEKNIIKFQLIHFSSEHAIFSEFEVDKTMAPPTVRYLHCDPAPPTTEYSVIMNSEFINSIAPLANIEIYDSNATLLKGIGCVILSVDGARMLSTPTVRNYASNTMDYIKQHGELKEQSFAHKNVSYIQTSTLPARFIRGLQYMEDKKENNKTIYGLNSQVLFSPAGNTLVNKQDATAKKSIEGDLKIKKNPGTGKEVKYNLRAERKLKQYQANVISFLEKYSFLDSDFLTKLNQHKMKGLENFCEANLSPLIETNHNSPTASSKP